MKVPKLAVITQPMLAPPDQARHRFSDEPLQKRQSHRSYMKINRNLNRATSKINKSFCSRAERPIKVNYNLGKAFYTDKTGRQRSGRQAGQQSPACRFGGRSVSPLARSHGGLAGAEEKAHRRSSSAGAGTLELPFCLNKTLVC